MDAQPQTVGTLLRDWRRDWPEFGESARGAAPSLTLDQYLSACFDQAVDQYDDGAREQRRPSDGDVCSDGCLVRFSECHVKEKSPVVRQNYVCD